MELVEQLYYWVDKDGWIFKDRLTESEAAAFGLIDQGFEPVLDNPSKV